MSQIGLPVSDVMTPAFIVDLDKVKSNCNKMNSVCHNFGLKLRAQTKTHKTIEGVRLQTDNSMKGLVTSTLAETEFFADNGCDDILFGYPFGPQHLKRITVLMNKLTNLHVMIDNIIALECLLDSKPPKGTKWSVFMKIDCGNKRAGIWWENIDIIKTICKSLVDCNHIIYQGLYVHCGDSYHESPIKARDHNIERLLKVKSILHDEGIKSQTVGIGSTPCCSQPSEEMKELTELHPGNYIFYDVQQLTLGSCTLDDIACTVATRIIGHYPHRNQMLIDCGFTGLTKQGYGQMKTGYGIFVGEPNLSLCTMTQEIGFVEPLAGELEFEKYPIGSMLFILPWHSCATAAMYSKYIVVKTNEVIEEWQPVKGW